MSDVKKIETVQNIAKSIIALQGMSWTVTRFDIQRYDCGFGITGYNGYLDFNNSQTGEKHSSYNQG